MKEGTKVFDCYGNIGVMSQKATADGKQYAVPECLKGYAFFVKNVVNHKGDNPDYPKDRAHSTFTRVVSLKKLIQVCSRFCGSKKPECSWLL